jgi:probable O-glycosylation ligase (exosortase A-associated)
MDLLSIDRLLTVLIIATLPVCFLRPWIGVLVFAWIGFMNPHRLIGGLAYDMPFAKMVAGATLAGLVVTRERYALPRTREVYLLGFLWVTFVCSTVFAALQPQAAWEKLEEISKILLMTLVTLVLFQDRRKLNLLLIVIACSIGYFALTGGVWAISTGFRERLYGTRGAISDNNALGFALTIVLPLFVLLRRQIAHAWMRHLLLVLFALSIVAVFATYSRGAFIGLCIALPLTLAVTRTKDVAVLIAAVVACLAIYITPRQWVERMQTITPTAYRDTSSGSKRMNSWYVAVRLGLDHPLLGAGFRPFEPDVYDRYIPGYWDYHDSHNHFLQVFAEHGFPGLLLFTGLLVCLGLTLLRTVRAVRGDPDRQWIAEAAQFIGVSLVAYVAGGMFLNMPYFDLFYQLVAVVLILQVAALAPGSVIAAPQDPLWRAVWTRLRGRPAATDFRPARVDG